LLGCRFSGRVRSRDCAVATVRTGTVTSLLVSALLLAGLSPASAGENGRVRGRVTVDKEPVTDLDVTLSPFTGDSQDSGGGQDDITDEKGRFAFSSVKPGRYKLNLGLTFEGDGQERTCKNAGFTSLSVQATDPGGNTFTIVSLESKKAFRAEAGASVKRNVKIDCKPDAELAETSGGESEDSTTAGGADSAFLAALEAAGLSGNYSSDEEAVDAARQACDDYRAEVTSGGAIDPFEFDFELLLVAVPYFCPDLQQYISEFPSP
jgi:hypothetical protein